MTDGDFSMNAEFDEMRRMEQERAARGSVKSRYWRVTRRPENQRQFPGEYSTRHMLTFDATQKEAMDWATGYFPTDTIVKVELWPGAPVSPNDPSSATAATKRPD